MKGLEINRGDVLERSVIIDEKGFYRIRSHKKGDITCGLTYSTKFFLEGNEWKVKNHFKEQCAKDNELYRRFLPLLNNYLRKKKLEKLLSI